jgi:hypothetical protein
MKNTQVINLGPIRDRRALLVLWEKVRERIMSGEITAFQAVFQDSDLLESVFVGGSYKHDSQKAARAALKLSAARALLDDDPPMLQQVKK